VSAFVLVPGAWLGGWAWQSAARRLREAGHDVYPVTLTGLGERVHLGARNVDLDTHIKDVVNLINYEDLRKVILVGHSYAGMVITGVSDRAPQRLGRLVYVDAGPPGDGTSMLDQLPPGAREQHKKQVRDDGDGPRLPMPEWELLGQTASLEGLDETMRRQIRARVVGHPFGSYTQPLTRSNPDRTTVRKVLITCSFSLDQVRQMIDSGHPWFVDLAGPEWSFLEVRTGHWPMFSEPQRLAEALMQLAEVRVAAS